MEQTITLNDLSNTVKLQKELEKQTFLKSSMTFTRYCIAYNHVKHCFYIDNEDPTHITTHMQILAFQLAEWYSTISEHIIGNRCLIL